MHNQINMFYKINKIKKIQKAGIEPATSSVLRMRDNHYTTSAIVILTKQSNDNSN